MQHSMTPIACLLFFYISSACAHDDPGTSETLSNTTANSSGEPTEGGPDSPTDAASGGGEESETSPGSGSTGDDPLVCNPADADEPNNSEDEAFPLPNISDDDVDSDVLESILAGDKDVDWFAYMGTDVAFAIVDPAGELSTDMTLRLCLFVDCISGPTKPFTCTKSIYEESPDQFLPGCCNSGESASVTIDLYCNGDGDESAFVYMRVDRGHADICVPYSIDYHF